MVYHKRNYYRLWHGFCGVYWRLLDNQIFLMADATVSAQINVIDLSTRIKGLYQRGIFDPIQKTFDNLPYIHELWFIRSLGVLAAVLSVFLAYFIWSRFLR